MGGATGFVVFNVTCRCGPGRRRCYHPNLQCFDVELPDLPVAEDVAEDFDQPIDPEDGRHDQQEYDPAVFLDSE